MKLSVVILNYNVRYFLELCLNSVQAAIQNIEAEIIVVDNNSADDSCLMVSELFPNVKLIANKTNSGFSKGNNIGVAAAKGEYLCILNPDTIVAEDTFLKLIRFAETQENLGSIGCQLIDGRGRFLPESKRNIPTPLVSLKKMLGANKSYYANHISADEIGEVDILVGAFMFLKTEVYQKVGGFDEDYFMYGEDIDLSYKILKAGYRNFYFGDTTVVHFKGESTLRDTTYAKRFYGAMQIFYQKHFKRNVVFNAMVWMGIKLASKFRSSKSGVNLPVKMTLVISDGIESSLENQLPNPISVQHQITDKIASHSMVVYDLNILKIKDVITDIKEKSDLENIVFRFLPKNSKFILGSDSAIHRGEVLQF